MNGYRSLLHKDLLRVRTGLLGWFILQLLLNGIVFWLRNQDLDLESQIRAYGSSVVAILPACIVAINGLLAFIFAAGLVAEDPPDLGGGTWRLRPVSAGVVYLEKLSASVVFTLLPGVLSLLPFLLLSHFGASVILQSLLAVSLSLLVPAVLGFGLCAFSVRHQTSPLLLLGVAVLTVAAAGVIEIRSVIAELPLSGGVSRHVLALLLFLAALFGSSWCYYRSAWRLPSLGLYFVLTGLSLVTLSTWEYPALEDLFRSERALVADSFRTEQSAAGATRVGLLHGLGKNQRFRNDEPWRFLGSFKKYSGIDGEMFLDGKRDQAQLLLRTASIPSRLDPGFLSAEATVETPSKVSLSFRGPDRVELAPGSDLVKSISWMAPRTASAIALSLRPALPSAEPQPYVRPGLDVRVHGVIMERRSVVEIPLREGAVYSGENEQVRVLQVGPLEKGRVVVSIERSCRARSVMVPTEFVVDAARQHVWPVARRVVLEKLPLGFITSIVESLEFSIPGDVVSPSGVGAYTPADLSSLTYVETSEAVLGAAVVALHQDEVHEQLPAFSEAMIQEAQKQQAELEARRQRFLRAGRLK